MNRRIPEVLAGASETLELVFDGVEVEELEAGASPTDTFFPVL